MENTKPLLVQDHDHDHDHQQQHHLHDYDYLPPKSFKYILKSVFWAETVKLWKIAGPIAFATICQFATETLTCIFSGHLGNLQLSAVSISITVVVNFAFGFLLGMGSALETLSGQAYGAGQVHMLGVYLQRSCIISLAFCTIILPIYISATPILKALGQEHDIAELAGQFTLQCIPDLFSLAIYFPTQKFLQAQSKVAALAWISFGALLLHVLWLWLFIYHLHWGTTGAAVAINLTSWVVSLGQAAYIMGWCREGWHGFSWSSFEDLWGFVKLSLASAVMLCLELWYPMSITIITGNLDNAVIAVGSITICMNINGLELMLFLGLSAAISVRVSNELGLGRPRAAKYSVYATISQSLLIGLIFMAIVLIAKDYFAYIFTSSEDMRVAVSKLAFLQAITMVLNSVQPVISGIAIGGGWQALVAYINLGCYYIFGLPLGFLLGYKAKLGVKGVWSGMIAGTALQTLLLLIVIYKTNWNKEVEQTAARMRRWGGQNMDGATADDHQKIIAAADHDHNGV